jgi:hypothetical protein
VKIGVRFETQDLGFKSFFTIFFSTFSLENGVKRNLVFFTFFGVNTSENVKIFSWHFPPAIKVKNVK